MLDASADRKRHLTCILLHCHSVLVWLGQGLRLDNKLIIEASNLGWVSCDVESFRNNL